MSYEPVFPFVPSVVFPAMALAFCAFIIWLVFRMAARQRAVLSQERLAAMERGVHLPPEAFLESRCRRERNSLRTGLVEVALGVGIVIALLMSCPGSSFWGWGLVVILVGVAHITYWMVRGRREWEEARSADLALMHARAAAPDGTVQREGGEPR